MQRTRWRTSSFSSDRGGECVEVADFDHNGCAVRDSKDPTGPALRFTATEWSAFTAGIRAGEFG
jgi:hypothetical protein